MDRGTFHKLLAGLFCLAFLNTCANYQAHYSKSVRDWQQERPEPNLILSHSIYLIGDAGNGLPGADNPALDLLNRKLRGENENSTVVFLGDNIYPNGMAPASDTAESAMDRNRLLAQLEALEGFRGSVYFTPGNHDWYGHGIDGLERQRSFLRQGLKDMGIKQKDFFLPNPGCVGPEEVDINDDLVLVFIDSQWWLQDWKGEERINQDCEVKSRDIFRIYFEEAIKGNRNRNVIALMHHPPFSAGPHGGQFTAKQHVFPLTDIKENLWIPLPIIGSLYPFLRASVGSKQDIAHPEYTELRDLMMAAARKNGSFIFAAGHEHSLQYLEQEDQAIIVSGSGSKRSATRISNHALFAYGQYGFSRLDVYEDGSVWVNYWAADPDEPEGKVVFRKKIREAFSRLEVTADTPFPFYAEGNDSVRMAIGEYDFQRNDLGRFFWGDHYRDAYRAEVNIPVLDLARFKGGVIPIKQGGGYQTNSLRLEGADGRQYTMRSVAKDPTRMVPYPINESEAILNVIKDGFSGAHPLAATPLPALQEALGLYHTNPTLYYVPRQPGLENFNSSFGDALYLVEERPDDDHWEDYASFGGPKNLISTPDMVEEIHAEHHYMVDRDWVLRARLFDITIGDWDRHDDQWRWGEFDMGDSVLYRPVPRDRDQAMGHYDGLMYFIGRETTPAARPLRPFSPHQKRIWWSNFGSRFFDHTFLTYLEWEDWQKEVHFIQDNLTDTLIDRAFREAWPEPIHALDADWVTATIKARRDTLMDMARRFYLKHAREVDVVGTHEKDLFEVERLNERETRVRVYDTNHDGDHEKLLYDRTFLTKETRELRLFGLQDDDIFRVTGDVNRGIKVRLIGGLGEDTFIDSSRVRLFTKKTILHDVTTEVSTVQAGNETKERFSPDPKYNTYNRMSADYNFPWWMFMPNIAANPDDDLLIGAAAMLTTYGFKKFPHATQQHFSARYAFSTSGFEAYYRGEFIDVFGDWELGLAAGYRSPLYASNFYGLGNETLNREEEFNDDYHRVRRRQFALSPTIMKIVNHATRFSAGPTFESYKVERTEGRFIDDIADAEESPLGEEFFEGQTFAGLRLAFQFNNLDDPVYPTRGLNFHADAGWKAHTNSSKGSYSFLNSAVTGYQALDNFQRFVFSSRIGFEHRFSDNYEFYQAAALGGTGPDANLRGFRRDRFMGKTSFYQNFDLRWRIYQSTNQLLPFSIGIYTGFDYGRVWTEDDDSNVWHYGYGGGLFLQPLDMMNIQFSAFQGDGGVWRMVLAGKFLF